MIHVNQSMKNEVKVLNMKLFLNSNCYNEPRPGTRIIMYRPNTPEYSTDIYRRPTSYLVPTGSTTKYVSSM